VERQLQVVHGTPVAQINGTTLHFNANQQRYFNNKRQVKQVAFPQKLKCW